MESVGIGTSRLFFFVLSLLPCLGRASDQLLFLPSLVSSCHRPTPPHDSGGLASTFLDALRTASRSVAWNSDGAICMFSIWLGSAPRGALLYPLPRLLYPALRFTPSFLRVQAWVRKVNG